jgi:ribosomal protein L40E
VETVNVAARCPACNAALRADAQWCSLCYHDLRPAPVAAPVQVPAPSQPLYGGSDPLTAPLLDLVLPPVPPAAVVVPQPSPAPESAAPVQSALQEWPCTSCGARNPLATTTCSVCGSKFLAAASEELSLVVPGVGDLQRLSRGQRIALAGGVLALVLVPLAAITFFLTPEPAQQPTGGSTDTTVTIVK